MSLAHAILGILADQPMTGYDLKTQCFDGSIAHFWPADQAQIYRTLDRMAGDGWATSAVEVQDNRPNRKVYTITPAGEAELDRWLADAELLPAPVREAALVQLFFAERIPPDRVREHLHRLRRTYADKLATFEAIPLPTLDTPGVPQRHRYQRMTLEMGLSWARNGIAWVDLCLAQLDEPAIDASAARLTGHDA